MTIHENIKNQIKEALRAKDTILLDTLRGLNALFMNEMLTQKSPANSEAEFAAGISDRSSERLGRQWVSSRTSPADGIVLVGQLDP